MTEIRSALSAMPFGLTGARTETTLTPPRPRDGPQRKTMKNFLLFAGQDDYPSGGMKDFAGGFDTLGAAVDGYTDRPGSYDWAHVLDLERGQVVWAVSVEHGREALAEDFEILNRHQLPAAR